MRILLQSIIEKALGARFIITVAVGITYCHIVWFCVHEYLGSLKANPERMEAFATGLMMGFTGTATFIFKAYFDRSDRQDEQSKNKKTEIVR